MSTPELLVGELIGRQGLGIVIVPSLIAQEQVEAERRASARQHHDILIEDVSPGAELVDHCGERAVGGGRHGETRDGRELARLDQPAARSRSGV